jgi:hypothetical protein
MLVEVEDAISFMLCWTAYSIPTHVFRSFAQVNSRITILHTPSLSSSYCRCYLHSSASLSSCSHRSNIRAHHVPISSIQSHNYVRRARAVSNFQEIIPRRTTPLSNTGRCDSRWFLNWRIDVTLRCVVVYVHIVECGRKFVWFHVSRVC